jgi:hypothetical protein
MARHYWQTKSFLTRKLGGGYPFGLELVGVDIVEVHGPFETAGDAMAYGTRLMNAYSGYTSCKVVRIETPQVGDQIFDRTYGWISVTEAMRLQRERKEPTK